LAKKLNVFVLSIERITLRSDQPLKDIINSLLDLFKLVLFRRINVYMSSVSSENSANERYLVYRVKFSLPFSSSIMLSIFICPYIIRLLVKRCAIDVIWSIGPIAGINVVLSKVDVPVIYDDHDRRFLFCENFIMRLLVKFAEETCILKANVVTAAGPTLFKSSKEIRNGRSVVLIPNPVDLKEFDQFRDFDKKYDLVYIGVIEPWSGLHHVIESLNIAIEYKPDIKLTIVGPITNKAYFNRLIRLVKIHNLNKNVIFLGKKSYKEVIRIVKSSKVGVAVFSPVESVKYAFPHKLLDYMASQIPIITSSIGDSAQLVKKANCGVIVDPNPQSIANAILDILSDEESQRNYGLNGYNYVSRYNIDEVSQKLIRLFELFYKYAQ